MRRANCRSTRSPATGCGARRSAISARTTQEIRTGCDAIRPSENGDRPILSPFCILIFQAWLDRSAPHVRKHPLLGTPGLPAPSDSHRRRHSRRQAHRLPRLRTDQRDVQESAEGEGKEEETPGFCGRAARRQRDSERLRACGIRSPSATTASASWSRPGKLHCLPTSPAAETSNSLSCLSSKASIFCPSPVGKQSARPRGRVADHAHARDAVQAAIEGSLLPFPLRQPQGRPLDPTVEITLWIPESWILILPQLPLPPFMGNRISPGIVGLKQAKPQAQSRPLLAGRSRAFQRSAPTISFRVP